ncbi:hypothetical protein GPL15_15010 [Clostridium sp. MCC353]|uniref:hypothetical protein n=1 Tax=Clostridium sp. MCC353 TaxID=2592646 RepID=UPI001C00CB71|nr:hypothetical protein [Clostridium sp. MCC353]MBT9777813.1 hypothetical protein [Clostridium sp. MCC353]
MKRLFKTAVFAETFIGIIFCLLYKLSIAPTLAAGHMDEQTGYPAVCFLASLILFIVVCLLKPARKFQKGYLIYASAVLLLICAVCFFIGIRSTCPVCNSPYF